MAQEALQRSTTAALGYGGLLTQNLSDWINAFAAANPSYTDTINSIISYLNTPTQLAYQNPEYIPKAIKAAMKSQPAVSTTPYTGNIGGKVYSGGRYW
jgi:Tfp pilus assembly protein PilX